MLRTLITPLIALAVLAVPATAAAEDVVFGSPLTDPADTIPYRNGWDQNVFNTAGPVGVAATQPGLIRQIKVKGGSGDGAPLEVKFRVIRPEGDRWRAISTPVTATLPPDDGQVHTYDVPDPRSFRVQPGDLIGIFNQGYGGAGRTWRIFSRQGGWTTQKVAINNGYNDNDLSPGSPVDAEGNSTVAYQNTELLLQAVESRDLCPGTDLPQEPCESKLYLGGSVKKSAKAVRYTWTIRNGGPHQADGLALTVNLPKGTTIPGLPSGCQMVPGPPLSVVCQLGSLPPPQLGNAVTKVSFVAVPTKLTKHFRATGQIDAPNVQDPSGGANHLKTVSTSTRYLGRTAKKH
jgi:hypothetical protein